MVPSNLNLPQTDRKIKEEQWNGFFNGKTVDTKIVSPIIFDSWQRSRDSGVNPNDLGKAIYISVDDQKEQKKIIERFVSEIMIIKKMAQNMGLNFQIFDENAMSIKEFNFNDYLAPEEIKFNFPRNLSEKAVGTNAVCLALLENRPIQIHGHENYNSYFHDFYCAAAPIHDINGKTIGVINTFSYQNPQTKEALGLISLLANLFDNLHLITNVSKELVFFDVTLKNIIEYLPYGLIFLNEDNSLKYYNEKILNVLKISNKLNMSTEISKYIGTINFGNNDIDYDKNEIMMTIEGRKRSLLLSTRNLHDQNKKLTGKIIIIEDTQSFLKSAGKLRGNRAIYTLDSIVGNNNKLIQAKSIAERIAKVSSSVLIYGESGTGKELFAQAIHNASFRSDKPFVAVNCGAIPSDLIESELFGYEAGAFTGALKGGKPGQIELADEGTLFLDEIESMPLNMQIKLLRVLSSGSIMKIGGLEEISIDIRIISATKKDLLKEIDHGTFREDLYYRISTFTLMLPSLRERKDDIPKLVNHFIKKYVIQFELSDVEITQEFLDTLYSYSWRGNVRELQNIIERAIVLLGQERILTKNYLPERMIIIDQEEKINQSLNSISKDDFTAQAGLLKVAEDIIIERVLIEEKGNISKAAKRLGITTPTIYNKINNSKRLQRAKENGQIN